MVPVALLALLLAAAPDTSVRVPGVPGLRFGLPVEAVSARGYAVEPEADGTFALQGATRFFGLPARAVLSFEDQKLSRARFDVDAVTPRQADWLDDEMRRMGFQRRCERRDEDVRDCEWRGRGAVVAVLLRDRSLSASVTCETCASVPESPAPP